MACYAGLVMFINFSVELLLLMASDRLCGNNPQWQSSVLAAVIGGIYAGICLLPRFWFMTLLYWRYAVLLAMVVLAFGITKQMLSRGAVFLLLNMAMENLTLGFNTERLCQLVLCGVLIALLCTKTLRGDGQGTVPVEILHNGIRVRLTALRDTGNKLQDPITGKAVLVIGADAARQLTGLTQLQLRTPIDTMTSVNVPGLRLVPYHTIGQETGFLLAMKMQNVRIANKEDSCLVAFAPEGLGREMKYQALTGGVI